MTSTVSSGLGDDAFFAGYHIGGDISDLSVHGGNSPLDVTPITVSAHARIGGLRDGGISLSSFMDVAAGMEHAAFSPLTVGDVIATYLRGQAIGSAAACCVARQANYDGTRASDGLITFKIEGQGDGYGLEWGRQLTAGLRTDATATNGASYNQGAASLWGAQAYLQAVSLTGASVTVTVQHSPDNATWTTLLAFAEIESANSNLPPSAQRVATPSYRFSATDASPAVFTAPGSSYANGEPVALAAFAGNAATTLPGGFSALTEYFVVDASTDTFSLAATSGGSAINSTSAGSGTVYPVVQQYVRAITAGTFTSFAFQVTVMPNPVEVTF